jgi:hypothetical protein
MLALAALAIALASPSPSPAPNYMLQTPPPEPNHVTIELLQSVLVTSGEEWYGGNGASTNASVRYEFQATPKARFANTVHWQRLSSTYAPDGETPKWWFDFTEYDDEFDAELGRPDYPLGVGVGYFDYTPIHDYTNDYNLRGFGFGIDRWPNYYTPRSFYYSAWYYPSLRGGQPDSGTYGILRADVGVNFRPNLVGPWNIRVGFMSDTWFAKDEYAGDSGFNGPYVGLSFWH